MNIAMPTCVVPPWIAPCPKNPIPFNPDVPRILPMPPYAPKENQA